MTAAVVAAVATVSLISSRHSHPSHCNRIMLMIWYLPNHPSHIHLHEPRVMPRSIWTMIMMMQGEIINRVVILVVVVVVMLAWDYPSDLDRYLLIEMVMHG